MVEWTLTMYDRLGLSGRPPNRRLQLRDWCWMIRYLRDAQRYRAGELLRGEGHGGHSCVPDRDCTLATLISLLINCSCGACRKGVLLFNACPIATLGLPVHDTFNALRAHHMRAQPT